MKECDCANPECGLPIGRCFLCGNPSEKANRYADPSERIEFTVGACCFVRVLALYEREWNALNRRTEPGWAPFNITTNADGFEIAEIQRDDATNLFESDQAAAWHVSISLGHEPTYPDGA